MPIQDDHTPDKLAILQRYTEKLLVTYIKRMSALANDVRLSETDRIRVAREITQDGDLLLQIAQTAGCEQSNDQTYLLDLRAQHFKRFVLHQLMIACEVPSNGEKFEQMRQWLLKLIESIEIAIGQFRFQEAQCFCDDWIEEQKRKGEFSYVHFMNNTDVMFYHTLLLFQLAVFLQGKPKHRIAWLIQSLESTPSCRVEQGVTLHNSHPMQPPTRSQVTNMLLSIYKNLKSQIIKHDMEFIIAEKYPQLTLQPITLLNNLLQDIESGQFA